MNLEKETMNGFDFDYLSECFYIKDGVLFWRNRPSCHFKNERAFNVFNARYANKPSGRINNGYMQTKLGGKLLQNHRIIFFITNGVVPEIVDHIDGNSLNNNINNLRSTTVSKKCNELQNISKKIPVVERVCTFIEKYQNIQQVLGLVVF